MFFLCHHSQEFLNQAPHFQPARGCQHQLLQLRSHFVTSPAPLTDSREPRGSAAPCTSMSWRSNLDPPKVKSPKVSEHCCALICEHSSHRGLAQLTAGAALQGALPSAMGDSSTFIHLLPSKSGRFIGGSTQSEPFTTQSSSAALPVLSARCEVLVRSTMSCCFPEVCSGHGSSVLSV